MEMGCSFGNLLFELRRYAAQGGKLICYEADPSYSGPGGRTRKRLREARLRTSPKPRIIHGQRAPPPEQMLLGPAPDFLRKHDKAAEGPWQSF